MPLQSNTQLKQQSYTIEKEGFGRYTIYKIKHLLTGAYFKIVPAYGATLNELVLLHSPSNTLVSCLQGYASGEEMEKQAANLFASAVLWPFANRTANASFEYKGEKYELERYSVGKHALHGFAFFQDFEVTDTQVSEKSASITCTWDYRGTEPGYPWEASLAINYEMNETGFHCSATIKNNASETMPFSFGFHPYFKPLSSVDDCLLHLPTSKRLELDNSLIPTGAFVLDDRFEKASILGTNTLDNNYFIDKPTEKTAMRLFDTVHKVGYEVAFNALPSNLQFLQVYTHPSRSFIGLEPQTSAINALNNKMGLVELAAAQQANYQISISLY